MLIEYQFNSTDTLRNGNKSVYESAALGRQKKGRFLPGQVWAQGPWKAADGSPGSEMGKCLKNWTARRPRLHQQQGSEQVSTGKLEAGRQLRPHVCR